MAQGNYIRAKENVVFLDPIGTGKTNLAVSLGLATYRQWVGVGSDVGSVAPRTTQAAIPYNCSCSQDHQQER